MIRINYRNLEPGQNYFVEYRRRNGTPHRFIGLGFIRTDTHSNELAGYALDDNILYQDAITVEEATAIQNEVGQDVILMVPNVQYPNLYDVHLPMMDFYFERIITAQSGSRRIETMYVDRVAANGYAEGPCFESFYPLPLEEPHHIMFYEMSPEKRQLDYRYIIRTALGAANRPGVVEKFEESDMEYPIPPPILDDVYNDQDDVYNPRTRRPPIPRDVYNAHLARLPRRSRSRSPSPGGKMGGGRTRRKIVKNNKNKSKGKKKTVRRRK
jgi:hypothetical protein